MSGFNIEYQIARRQLAILKTINVLLIYRHPAPAARPKYREILTKLLDEENKVLSIPVEDASSSAQACFLGAPIKEGENMYCELQEKYLIDFDNKHNPDYEYVETDHEDI